MDGVRQETGWVPHIERQEANAPRHLTVPVSASAYSKLSTNLRNRSFIAISCHVKGITRLRSQGRSKAKAEQRKGERHVESMATNRSSTSTVYVRNAGGVLESVR